VSVTRVRRLEGVELHPTMGPRAVRYFRTEEVTRLLVTGSRGQSPLNGLATGGTILQPIGTPHENMWSRRGSNPDRHVGEFFWRYADLHANVPGGQGIFGIEDILAGPLESMGDKWSRTRFGQRLGNRLRGRSSIGAWCPWVLCGWPGAERLASSALNGGEPSREIRDRDNLDANSGQCLMSMGSLFKSSSRVTRYWAPPAAAVPQTMSSSVTTAVRASQRNHLNRSCPERRCVIPHLIGFKGIPPKEPRPGEDIEELLEQSRRNHDLELTIGKQSPNEATAVAFGSEEGGHPNVGVHHDAGHAPDLRCARASREASLTSRSISAGGILAVLDRIRVACASHHDSNCPASMMVSSTSALSGRSTRASGRKTPSEKTARMRAGRVIALSLSFGFAGTSRPPSAAAPGGIPNPGECHSQSRSLGQGG
jgi:hypothetical protein